MRLRSGLEWFFGSGALVVLLLASELRADIDPYRGFQQIGGGSCCGGNDCAPLPDGAVHPVRGGYQVDGWGFVENGKAQPGPDQHYHMCHSGTTLYCFLTPNPGV